MKKGLRKIAKLDRMNTRFQRGAVEITLDLFKGLSHFKKRIIKEIFSYKVEITLDLFKGLSQRHDIFLIHFSSFVCGNYIRPV